MPREVTSRAKLEQVAFDLFDRQGFERTTIDDIASAAGIGRRTFFRDFPTKNDVGWGDFDAELAKLRRRLAATPPAAPMMEAIRREIVEFNRIAPEQVSAHRRRMDLILRVPSLQAHSTLRYAAWRQVIADFVAYRTGQPADALVPQAIGYAMLGVAIAAYEQWLRSDGSVDLCELLDAALSALAIAAPSARATGGGLPVGGGLAPSDLPAAGQALQPGDHANGQLRHGVDGEIRTWSCRCDAEPVDSEFPPGGPCPGRAEVGPAMLLAAADNGRRYPDCLLSPLRGARPASRPHQVADRLADSRRRSGRWLRPAERPGPPPTERHQDESRPKLGHTMVACVHDLPPGVVPEVA